MNWWLKLAKSKGVDQVVKDRLRSSPFFVSLFKKFNVSMDTLDGLKIVTEPLNGAYCKTNGDTLVIDDDLVKTKQIVGPKFHFIAHEILHFLKRQSGAKSENVENGEYFSDPEEVEAFSTAIAFILSEGDGLKKIKDEFLPLVKVTINDDATARKFLVNRVNDAKKMLLEMS